MAPSRQALEDLFGVTVLKPIAAALPIASTARCPLPGRSRGRRPATDTGHPQTASRAGSAWLHRTRWQGAGADGGAPCRATNRSVSDQLPPLEDQGLGPAPTSAAVPQLPTHLTTLTIGYVLLQVFSTNSC